LEGPMSDRRFIVLAGIAGFIIAILLVLIVRRMPPGSPRPGQWPFA
jgi:hypothetical protein